MAYIKTKNIQKHHNNLKVENDLLYSDRFYNLYLTQKLAKINA